MILNWQDILNGAEIAKMAYRGDDSQFIGHRIIVDNDSVILFRNRSGIHIAFEGSNLEIEDWIENLDFNKKRDFHEGFSGPCLALLKEITEDMDEPHSKIPLHLYGHSRGGIMAVFAAHWLKMYGYNVMAIYSYGAPRGGSKVWAEKFALLQIPHYRVVNGGDRVPMLPRAWWGFRHDCDAIKIRDSWWTSLWVLGYASHSIDKYIQNIKKYL